MSHDAWGISSGLPLDDADVTITKVEFGYNAAIGAGILCANITFTTDDGEDHQQSFSVGDGWTAVNKGQGIDGRKTINNRTNYGRLVESMLKAVGGAEGMAAAGFTNPGGFRDAATFVGSRWHLGTTKVITKNPTTGAERERDAIIATGFLSGPSGAAASKTTASKTAAKGGKASLADTDPDLFAELVDAAREHDDHDSFMEAVLSRPDVEGNPTALNAVMSTKPGSIWAAR